VSAVPGFTLLVLEREALLWDEAGALLGRPGPDGPSLRAALPPRARVQLILAGPGLEVRCQETPALGRREQLEARRLMAGTAPAAHLLEPEPQAGGGHVLWLAAAGPDLAGWLCALRQTGARLARAVPWQRAFLGGPGCALHLVLFPGSAQLLVFRGRGLVCQRPLPLPGDARELGRLVAEELARLLPFIRHRHRGLAPGTLLATGASEPQARELACLGRDLGLEVVRGPELPAALLAGIERQGGLDLLPEAWRCTPLRRACRTAVRAAALALALALPGTQILLRRQEAALEREVRRAEAARETREALAREADAAARQRFGLLRVRRAEARQLRAAGQIERLGRRIFLGPGVELKRVEILQAPGEDLRHRFTVEGEASARQGLSTGALAAWYEHLAGHPGMALDPLGEVRVVDREQEPRQAVTRFKCGGLTP